MLRVQELGSSKLADLADLTDLTERREGPAGSQPRLSRSQAHAVCGRGHSSRPARGQNHSSCHGLPSWRENSKSEETGTHRASAAPRAVNAARAAT